MESKNNTAILENSLVVYYKTKHNFPYHSAIAFLDMYPREMKTSIYTKPEHEVYSRAICSNEKSGNNPNVSQYVTGQTNYGMSIPWDTIQQ